MDSGSGHIYDLNTMEIPSVKGKMVEWKIGEEVEIKGCRFKVEKINCIPEDTIVLKGLAQKDLFKELAEKSDAIHDEKTYKDGLKDFLK